MHPSAQKVADAAQALGLDIEIVEFAQTTRSAQEAADAIGCDVAQIVKSLCFVVNGRATICLVSGANQLDERKLAGVLIELVPGAPHAAVIGIGLNRRLPADLPPEVCALACAWPPATPPARLLASLLKELGRCADEFAHGGFAALRSEWQGHHAHQNQAVRLCDELTGERHGVCRGVDVDGALLLETPEGEKRAELKVGVSYSRNVGVEHNVINASDHFLSFVEVELKP